MRRLFLEVPNIYDIIKAHDKGSGRVVVVALTIGDVIRLTICQNVAQQEVCNVFAYVVDNVTGNVTLEDVITRFISDVLDELNVIQSAAVLNDSVRAENLTNGIDFFEQDWTGTGDRAGAAVSVFTAMSFRLNRSSKVTRNGFKRFPGISVDYENNSNTWVTGDTDIGNLENSLGDTLIVDGDTVSDQATISPIILGRNSDGSPDLSRFQNVASVSFQNTKTTQNSRKIGSGT